MKFSLQIHQVEVPVPGGELTDATMEQQIETFIERYESDLRRRARRSPAPASRSGVFRVVGRGRIRTPALPKLEAGPAASPAGTRQVYWEGDGFVETDIWDGAAIGPGTEIAGPAIVEMSVTTIVVQPGQRGRVDDYGSFVITV